MNVVTGETKWFLGGKCVKIEIHNSEKTNHANCSTTIYRYCMKHVMNKKEATSWHLSQSKTRVKKSSLLDPMPHFMRFPHEMPHVMRVPE